MKWNGGNQYVGNGHGNDAHSVPRAGGWTGCREGESRVDIGVIGCLEGGYV